MVNMKKWITSIVHRSFMQTDKDCFDNKQWFNGQATTDPSIATIILKTCNMFKQEDNKEMEKHRRQSDNNSHESLMV